MGIFIVRFDIRFLLIPRNTCILVTLYPVYLSISELKFKITKKIRVFKNEEFENLIINNMESLCFTIV